MVGFIVNLALLPVYWPAMQYTVVPVVTGSSSHMYNLSITRYIMHVKSSPFPARHANLRISELCAARHRLTQSLYNQLTHLTGYLTFQFSTKH